MHAEPVSTASLGEVLDLGMLVTAAFAAAALVGHHVDRLGLAIGQQVKKGGRAKAFCVDSSGRP